MAAELGQQTVEFTALVQRAAEDSYLALKELVERSKASAEPRSDAEKKIDLLKFVAKTRQRMLRLRVLAKWCQQVPLIHYCQQLASTLSSHESCFTQTADSLFFMHEGLQQARAPSFDVPSAIEVFLTGSYQRLPKCIEDLSVQSALSEDEQRIALKKLDTLVRSKLLEVVFPKEISDVTVSDGTAVLRVDEEFKVFLTLGYRGHLSLWRILHLELLVGEKNGPIKLEESRRYALGDDLERRMAAADNPFLMLYTVLHEFCIALVMDTVLRQVQVLRQGRWKDAIRFELVSDGTAGLGGNSNALQLSQDVEIDSSGPKTPGLKIIYWLDLEKNSAASDFSACPYIRIEPGHDTQIKCLHNSFVLDPFTDKEASFSLDQSCIDVEKLLLRVISCNRHTRLLEIQRELTRNGQICRGSDDVILCHENRVETDSQKKGGRLDTADYFGDEVLRVRAFGASYIILGMNIRNGKFLLQSSKNVLSTSTLVDFEDALNLGNLSATDVFTKLRSKSILNVFASTGRFLGLQVHDHISNLKIPDTISHGSDMLLMGFPKCSDIYFLLLQVDQDFKPVFNLLESQFDTNGKPQSLGDVNQFMRSNKIDIGQMQMIDDELNISLFDWEKLHSLSNMGTFNQITEHGVNPEFGLEASIQLPCSQSNFSSVVDEIFGFEKGASSNFTTVTQHSSSSKMSPLSHVNSLHISQPGMKSGISSPKSEFLLQQSQTSNIARLSSGFKGSSNAAYPTNRLKGFTQNVATSSLSSCPIRSSPNKLSSSRSDQDLSNHKSQCSTEVGQFPNMDDDHLKFANEPSKELNTLDGSRPFSLQNLNSHRFKSSSTGNLDGLIEGQTPDCQGFSVPDYDGPNNHEKRTRKRSFLDILKVIPSFQMSKGIFPQSKRRKLLESPESCFAGLALPSSTSSCSTSRYTFGHLLSEANHAVTSLNVFVSVLLHVVKHCSLCIKHAQLTSQMDALDIPYVEEVGLRIPSSNLWLKLPFATDNSWHRICLRLGKPGTMCWDVKIEDLHFRELWELQRSSTSTTWGSAVRFANASEVDSHIHCDPEGIVLCYESVESDSIQRLVSDLRRLYNARLFACGMRKLVGLKSDKKIDEANTISDSKITSSSKVSNEGVDKLSEQIRRTFKIEAVGLVTLWFSYGSMPMVHFVVEWEASKDGCTMHISPDQLWPHNKFLEDFVNGGEVASFLDCIRLTAEPLLALSGAIRPARIPVPVSAGYSPIPKQDTLMQPHGNLANTSSNVLQPSSNVSAAAAAVIAQFNGQNFHTAATVLSAAGRSGSGLVPSSLLPFDVSVVLRGPYWIRIIYRKKFAVDMRCFAGDQVWLQPATPPKGGPQVGGSLPCPQFRPFIMEHVAQGLNALEPNFTGSSHTGLQLGSSNTYSSLGTQPLPPPVNRLNVASAGVVPRPNIGVGTPIVGGINRIGSTVLASTALSQGISGVPLRISPGTGFAVHVKGELNTAFIGLGDDGGYGGGWVPLAALKKVLRGILKYLGVLWLFAQLPDLLKEILGSILKENEGTLLNLDQEQPALRFFVGGYVFAVSVHRVQLLLQVLSVKRFHHQQQQQQNQSNTQEELTPAEINEICDYFSRRITSEPYDASRVASFITLLTLPVSVLREFLKLISWKKGLSHSHVGDIATTQRARIELCLENHLGSISDENSETSSSSKSNIHHDREHSSVDFALTFVLDPALIPHMNAAGGAAWLPYCVSVRLKYFFGENAHVSFLGMEGSHGGRACWSRHEDWERCKQRMARTVEISNGTTVDISQGRLKLIAETLQRTLQGSLQQLKDGASSSISSGI